jgi:hypothetical protein
MGDIDLREIKFSQAVEEDFKDSMLWKKILNEERFINPLSV